MGDTTGIQWTDHTFNPWRGCSRVSPGCDHCYAEAWSKRNPKSLGVWGDDGTRVIAAEAYWRAPIRWNREAEQAGKRARVFCASLADVFEDRPELYEPRARLAALIAATPSLDWQLLTKRPENAARLWHVATTIAYRRSATDHTVWLPNIWLGTTVENQAMADMRIPHLMRVPAPVRFLSCEPLLDGVDLESAFSVYDQHGEPSGPRVRNDGRPAIDWVIIGGESGSHARPFDLAWARSLRDQCREAGVSCFVKQLGARSIWNDSEREGRLYEVASLGKVGPDRVIVRLDDKHGGDPAEWPEDLRVREMPR